MHLQIDKNELPEAFGDARNWFLDSSDKYKITGYDYSCDGSFLPCFYIRIFDPSIIKPNKMQPETRTNHHSNLILSLRILKGNILPIVLSPGDNPYEFITHEGHGRTSKLIELGMSIRAAVFSQDVAEKFFEHLNETIRPFRTKEKLGIYNDESYESDGLEKNRHHKLFDKYDELFGEKCRRELVEKANRSQQILGCSLVAYNVLNQHLDMIKKELIKDGLEVNEDTFSIENIVSRFCAMTSLRTFTECSAAYKDKWSKPSGNRNGYTNDERIKCIYELARFMFTKYRIFPRLPGSITGPYVDLAALGGK